MIRLKLSSALAIVVCFVCSIASAAPLPTISPQQLLPLSAEQQLTPMLVREAAVAVHGDIALVGLHRAASGAQVQGFVNVYSRTASSDCAAQACWVLIGTLKRPGAAVAEDYFGHSLAYDGNTLLVGSPAAGADAVFVYSRVGQTFVPQQAPVKNMCTGSGCSIYAGFGQQVAIAGDRAAVSELTASTTGQVYVPARNADGTWGNGPAVSPNAGILNRDQFGFAVDLTDERLLVGGPGGERAWTFVNQGGNWIEESILQPWDQPSNGAGAFGENLALSGSLAAISAPVAENDGAVYLFKRSAGAWSPLQKLVAPDGTAQDTYQFGFVVRISGNRIAVMSFTGVYLFEERGGTWEATAKLVNASNFAVVESLDGMDIDGATVVVATATGPWVYDLSGTTQGTEVVIEAETMKLTQGYSSEPGYERIYIANTATNPTGYAELPSFPGASGTYDIEVQLVAGGTGLSVVELYRNGERLGYEYFDYSTQAPKLVLPDVSLEAGDGILLAGYAEGNGGARVDKLVFIPKSLTPVPANQIVVQAENTQLGAGYAVESGLGRIVISDPANAPAGYAFFAFPGATRNYRVQVDFVGGGSGLSVVEFYLNGERLGYEYFDYSNDSPKLVLPDVPMANGDQIALYGYAEGDGGARIDKIVFVPQ